MPARDGRGPQGYGPMTGRGFGYCVSEAPGIGRGMNVRRGMGMQRGRGVRRGGYGVHSGYVSPVRNEHLTEHEELQLLVSDARQIKEELARIESRICELTPEKNKEE